MGRIFVSSARPSSPWTAPVVVATGHNPEVALSTSGTAFVVFETASGWGAIVRTGGAWSSTFALDTGSSNAPVAEHSVAADAAGNALVAWHHGGIMARIYRSGVGWQPSTTLASGSGMIRVAMNEAGSGIVGWCDSGHLYGMVYDPVSGWGSSSGTGGNCCVTFSDVVAPGVSVAIAESGDAFVAGAACQLRHGASGWTPSVTDSFSTFPSSPQIAASPDGHATLAWLSGSSPRIVRVKEYVPGSGWGPTIDGPSGIGAGPIGVGTGSTSAAAVIFRRGIALQYVTHTPGSAGLSSPIDIAPATTLSAAPYFIHSGGNPLEGALGVTVWQRGGGEEIWGARLGI